MNNSIRQSTTQAGATHLEYNLPRDNVRNGPIPVVRGDPSLAGRASHLSNVHVSNLYSSGSDPFGSQITVKKQITAARQIMFTGDAIKRVSAEKLENPKLRFASQIDTAKPPLASPSYISFIEPSPVHLNDYSLQRLAGVILGQYDTNRSGFIEQNELPALLEAGHDPSRPRPSISPEACFNYLKVHDHDKDGKYRSLTQIEPRGPLPQHEEALGNRDRRN